MKEGRSSELARGLAFRPRGRLTSGMEIRDARPGGGEEAWRVVLRPLMIADADEAAEVIRTAFAAQSRPTNPPSSALRETGEAIAGKIAEGGGFGVFEAGALVAAALWRVDGDALHVARVSVALGARGRGVARSLIAACENEARKRRLKRMTLKTRLELPENERLFERCGFTRREIEAHLGFDTPTTAVMEKVLA
jgi:GNAT superfamily N-acetyltransferase